MNDSRHSPAGSLSQELDTHAEWRELNRAFVPASPEPQVSHFRIPGTSDQARDFKAWMEQFERKLIQAYTIPGHLLSAGPRWTEP